MVAASVPCSQVSPDNLQAPPVLVSRVFAPKKLDMMAAVFRCESEPCERAKDNAPRTQCCRHATTVRHRHQYVSILLNTQRLAVSMSTCDYP